MDDNESVKALKELLADGLLTIPAFNYGGFEKVCSLGNRLPSNDSQIVIFYASNSWDYTRHGKISDADGSELKEILGGDAIGFVHLLVRYKYLALAAFAKLTYKYVSLTHCPQKIQHMRQAQRLPCRHRQAGTGRVRGRL